MSDQLTIYNGALARMRERSLGSLTENREPRRVLDSFYSQTVAYCLEQGLWFFCQRVVSIDASTTVKPAFAFNYAFTLPVDYVRTFVVSTAAELDPPLTAYKEETGYIYSNATPIYLAYVSNDAEYGLNLGAWPASFADYVEARLAWRAAPRISTDKEIVAELAKDEKRARIVAKANDAMNEGPNFPPVSFWVRSRRGAFQPGAPIPGSGFGNV